MKNAGQLEEAYAVENCSMENEHVWRSFSEMDQPSGYYSIVVVKEHKGN